MYQFFRYNSGKSCPVIVQSGNDSSSTSENCACFAWISSMLQKIVSTCSLPTNFQSAHYDQRRRRVAFTYVFFGRIEKSSHGFKKTCLICSIVHNQRIFFTSDGGLQVLDGWSLSFHFPKDQNNREKRNWWKLRDHTNVADQAKSHCNHKTV